MSVAESVPKAEEIVPRLLSIPGEDGRQVSVHLRGVADMTFAELKEEIASGGRFVRFHWCASIVVMTFRQATDIYFIKSNESAFLKGLPYTLATLLVGWWGFPWGFIYTPVVAIGNLIGGEDLTDAVGELLDLVEGADEADAPLEGVALGTLLAEEEGGTKTYEPEDAFALSLQRTRDKLGRTPRIVHSSQRTYLHLIPPPWARDGSDDRFQAIFRDQEMLLRNGTVVWACIVQANSALFEDDTGDCPAAVVFSLDQHFESAVEELCVIGSTLYSQKGRRRPTPELAEFARVITNEYEAPMNVPVPLSMTANRQVFYTTIMVYRKHLPVPRLVGGWFPLLASPDRTTASMIVPSEYWCSALVALWKKIDQAA